MSEISVIVPVYNVARYLPDCIEGILAQTFQDFELILVNDGSSDNSGAICEDYAAKDGRVQVIHQHNQGSGPARNAGMKAAQGKYLYFCDPDDRTASNLLGDNYELAERYEANLVMFGYIEEIETKKGKLTSQKYAEAQWLEDKPTFRAAFEDLYKNHLMNTLWNKLYRKDFLIANDCWFPNKRVGQDTVFNYHVLKELHRVYIHEQIYYYYVNDRWDSSTNRFRQDRFQLRYDETLEFEKLMEHWDRKEIYKELVYNDWLNTFYVGANNVIQKNSPLTRKAKRRELSRMQQTPHVQSALREVPLETVNSMFMKVIIASIRYTPLPAVYYLFLVRQQIKDKLN